MFTFRRREHVRIVPVCLCSAKESSLGKNQLNLIARLLNRCGPHEYSESSKHSFARTLLSAVKTF